jgi:hypothetical protein
MSKIENFFRKNRQTFRCQVSLGLLTFFFRASARASGIFQRDGSQKALQKAHWKGRVKKFLQKIDKKPKPKPIFSRFSICFDL